MITKSCGQGSARDSRVMAEIYFSVPTLIMYEPKVTAAKCNEWWPK